MSLLNRVRLLACLIVLVFMLACLIVLVFMLACLIELASARTHECTRVQAQTCIKSVPYVYPVTY